MKSRHKSGLVLISVLFTMAESAHGQPPDPVTSDGAQNTAMGTSALLNLTSGQYNTAAGFQALDLNSQGSYNTATGMYALSRNTTAITTPAADFRR